MKKIAVIQFKVLAFTSGIVAVLTFFAGGLVVHHWNGVIDGRAALPDATVFSTKYGYLIPLGCCLASIICAVIAFKRDKDVTSLWWWFTVIVIIELIGIAIIPLLSMLPAVTIMYRLM